MSDIKSPFPGMDPYLEHPDEWSGVHVDLIVACRNLIRNGLPSNFPDAFIIRNSPIRDGAWVAERLEAWQKMA